MKGNPYSLEPRYDANGNLLNDERNRYTWDADIHLLSVSTRSAGVSPAPESTTHFRYDALHRRVARWDHEGTLTRFVHDGWNVIEERTTNPKSKIQNLKSHTWGHDISGKPQGAGGIGGLLKTRSSTSNLPSTAQSACFHYDSNGNVVLLTDSEGNESARYAYDAFGKTMLASGPMAQENKYRFSTKPVEETSGLCYYGYRYYAPALGRWLCRDPKNHLGHSSLWLTHTYKEQNTEPRTLWQVTFVKSVIGANTLNHLRDYTAVVNDVVNGQDIVGLGSEWYRHGRCCNTSGEPEWVLVAEGEGAGEWEQLESGECVGSWFNDFDCEGMTCGGGFYEVGLLTGTCATPGCDSWPFSDGRWEPDGGDSGAASPEGRGSGDGNFPPGYDYHPRSPGACCD
jgi:RHS repeat-associated protein